MSCSAICRRGCWAGAWRSTPTAARRAIDARSRGRSASTARRRRAACSPSSTTTWWARCASSRSSAATIRATSRWCRSAAPARCTAARWPSCSASRRVLVPPAPGVLCADGLLAADLKAEFSRTLPKDGQGRHRDGAQRSIAELSRAGRRLARRGEGGAGRPPADPRRADALSRPGRRSRGRLGRRRCAASRRPSPPRMRASTASSSIRPIELVTLRIEATGRMPAPQRPVLPAGAGTEPHGRFAVHFASGVDRGAAVRPRHARRRRPPRRVRPSSPSSTPRRWSLPGWSGEVHPRARSCSTRSSSLAGPRASRPGSSLGARHSVARLCGSQSPISVDVGVARSSCGEDRTYAARNSFHFSV